MMKTNTIPRDGALDSPWQKELTAPIQSGHAPVEVYDCLIVGGGITGMTAALLLQKAGKRTVIAEAHCIGFGTTGGTSAHINTFADTTYKEAESAFGAEGAQLFANAISEGFALIKSHIDQFKIDCDYEPKTGFLYAENEDEVKLLADIHKGARQVGVPVQYTLEVPTPVPFQKALLFDGQAQFHPLKYLTGLQKAYLAAGGVIRQNTFMIFTDYPAYGFSPEKHRPADFRLAGDPRLAARVMLVRTGKGKMPDFMVSVKGCKAKLTGTKTKDGHLEFTVPGDSEIHINWKNHEKEKKLI
ncbi:MAG TPA: FAD-dependent oxidoreductase [Puia sp.]|nr:FAD-dependent oxidoreductase [Puia sp.]